MSPGARLLVLGLAVLGLVACAGAPVTTTDDTLVIPMFGQSNCGGHGPSFEISKADQAPVPGYITWEWLGHPWFIDDVAWKAGGINGRKYFGPELYMGKALAAAGKRVAIIKVSDGGAALGNRWLPSENDLYPILISRTRAATEALTAAGISWRFAALVPTASEGDANTLPLATTWADTYTTILEAFRAEFGVPNLPDVFARLSSNMTRNFLTEVRTQETAYPLTRPLSHVVNTDDLPLINEPGEEVDVHYGMSQRTLGERYADVILSLL